MKNNKLFMLVWIFIIACMMIGGFLGIYIIGRATGEYNYDLVIPIVVGTVIGFLITLLFTKLAKKKKGNVPDFDERNMMLMKRYLLIVLYFVLFGSGAALLILYAMGIHTIETGMLIVFLIGLYILIGVGALVTKRF